MTNKPENPCAFPDTVVLHDGNIDMQVGMSLRDYFAGQVLPNVYTAWVNVNNAPYNLTDMVKESYRLADAMLEHRNIDK